MNDIVVHKNINPLTPEMRKKFLPYAVLRYLTGGRIIPNYRGLPECVCLEWNNCQEFYHVNDFSTVKEIGDAIWSEVIQSKNLLTTLMTLPTSIIILQEAQKRIELLSDPSAGKRRIILIKDQSGCGYWRMETPAKYLDLTNLYVECTQVEVIYDMLLEYHTIVVQRTHSWDHYYILERLKKLGKRIIYDIDDDIFNIPMWNPASKVIKADQIAAARAIMELSDVITTPSDVIKERFGLQNKTVVIPNAIDLDDWPPMTGTPEDLKLIGSLDGFQRIFWQGSASHEQDWSVCMTAIENLLKKRDNLRLVLLGYMPKQIREKLSSLESNWMHRIEFGEFSNVETYIRIMKQIRGDVGICPLVDDTFNSAKSSLKVVEYAAACLPSVSSNCTPYKEVITDGKNGYLASTPEEWEQKISELLDSPEKSLGIVRECRKMVSEKFNIKKVVKDWQTLFLS